MCPATDNRQFSCHVPRRNPDVYGLVLLHLTYQGNMQLVQLLLPVPTK